MLDVVKYNIPTVFLPLGNTEINGIKLRKFQEEILQSLNEKNKICLQAPTGSGKTFTIFALLIKAMELGRPVVALYPSRELVKDQARSVIGTLKRMGLNLVREKGVTAIFNGEIKVNGKTIRKGEINVVTLTSETKDDAFEILKDFLPVGNRFLILLTVPEYPYMYLTQLGKNASFSQVIEGVIKGKLPDLRKDEIRDIFNQFAKFFNGYYFIDEFHLYTGISKSSLSLLIKMIEDYNKENLVKPKFVFSSATPTNIECEKVIKAETSNEGDKIRKEVDLIFHFTSGNPQEEIVKQVKNLLSPDRKTAIILDRVYYIAQLCNEIEAKVVWGLDKEYGKCKKSENIREEKLIIGNHAISFGVDIPGLDYGIIHAHDAETAIQRIGRFGRTGDGKAEIHIFLKAPGNLEKIMVKDEKINFYEYVTLIEKLYKKRLDDRLDEIFFSKLREEVMFKTYEVLYQISNSMQVSLYPIDVDLPALSSSEDYFNLFAFRPGGIKGEWCGKNESDDFFTMLRNFKYDYERNCFDENFPIKQNPEVVVEEGTLRRFINKIVKVDNFVDKTGAMLIMKGDKRKISLSKIKGINDAFVIPIKHNLWDNFTEMAKLVSTYSSALVVCEGINLTECKKADALLLFV